jgi:hypothetical protein
MFLYRRNGRKAIGRKILSIKTISNRTLFASAGRYVRNVGADNKIISP